MRKPGFTYAGRLERVLAYLIDTLLLLFPNAFLLQIFGDGGAMMLAGFLCQMAYFSYSTASGWQASPGQRFLGIQLIHANGTPLTLRDAMERWLASYMPFLPLYVSFLEPQMAGAIASWLMLIWYLPMLYRDDRTGLHDRLCNTRVIAGKTGKR